MSDMDEITKLLAKKYSGLSLKEDPKPEIKPVKIDTSSPYIRSTARSSSYEPVHRNPSASANVGPKVFPSEKFGLKTNTSKIMPTRPPITIGSYSDEEFEEMLAVPVKRGWDFQTWLEVIGVPVDLHDKYDSMYNYFARAYLDGKAKAHKQ